MRHLKFHKTSWNPNFKAIWVYKNNRMEKLSSFYLIFTNENRFASNQLRISMAPDGLKIADLAFFNPYTILARWQPRQQAFPLCYSTFIYFCVINFYWAHRILWTLAPFQWIFRKASKILPLVGRITFKPKINWDKIPGSTFLKNLLSEKWWFEFTRRVCVTSSSGLARNAMCIRLIKRIKEAANFPASLVRSIIIARRNQSMRACSRRIYQFGCAHIRGA